MARGVRGGWSIRSPFNHFEDGGSGRATARFRRPASVACRLGADRLLQVLAFLAAGGTELCQHGELLPGLVDVAGLDIKLAEIFASRLVLRLHLDRLGIVG